ncbi:MAG: hypothetical protein ACQETQ_05035 [Spirochaetota bacterium]
MKRIVLVILLLSVLSLGGAFAETETFGLGVLLGEPTGISAKLRLDDTSALDAAAAWSFIGQGAFYFHADYLFHFNDVLHVHPGELPVYVGIGGKVLLKDDPRLGARIPVGLAYEFADAPLDVFFEIAPGVGIFPETDIDFGGGIGMRYYFGSGGS